MDGHGSHITGNVIAYCIDNSIDLLILPPHCSHILQPLDIGVFRQLKQFHSQEMDRYSYHTIGRIKRADWVQSLIRIRTKAFISSNIKSSWKGSGLIPYNPNRVVNNLPNLPPTRPITPENRAIPTILEYPLLLSSPPISIDLQSANKAFYIALRSSSVLITPGRKYTHKVTTISET